MIQRPLSFYALCGSQRQASTSLRLLEALQLISPDGISVEICDLIGSLPIFNPDQEGDRTPAVVETFAAKIRDADGLIVSCPEYAHGIPGGFSEEAQATVLAEMQQNGVLRAGLDRFAQEIRASV
jgi:chromate reductase